MNVVVVFCLFIWGWGLSIVVEHYVFYLVSNSISRKGISDMFLFQSLEGSHGVWFIQEVTSFDSISICCLFWTLNNLGIKTHVNAIAGWPTQTHLSSSKRSSKQTSELLDYIMNGSKLYPHISLPISWSVLVDILVLIHDVLFLLLYLHVFTWVFYLRAHLIF